ncbi:unnamed protein product [Didymodactylos carnosus]|uniref:Uncharacterized protein n=1 Tax=Didymodactylos carnosus TaxID=1234261 RepID=A0A8S2RGJ9_9BILA|nr:unnamed protein product [Didymodactylos carnosus]CAF4164526.1 unnamed protein product [Didymodactylos carnosus]
MLTEKITTMERGFLQRLEKSFGDIENANEMAIKVFNNMKNECLSTIESEYKTLMKDGTRLNADKLVDESDKVFQKSNAKDEIFEYITNMLKYMKKVYSNIYESKDTEVQQQCNKKYTELYNQDYKILIEILDELENIFINNTITVNDENYFTKMFKVYLEGNSVELVEINKQVSLPIIMTNLKKLRHSNNLFKNISILIYKISNPKIFITGFKNTLKSENAKYCPKLILSNSLQTEKDNIKAENLTTALGCIGQCPYCGCKCTVNMEKHDAHQSTKHRLMAFKRACIRTSSIFLEGH